MKKLFSLTVLFGLAALLFWSSCDKIDPPYKESEGQEQDTTPKRKILLEEFTGHLCPNCPQGAIVAQQLKQIYGEQLIIISVHYADFAEPGTSPFDYDFRSATGNEIGAFFQPAAFPSGMICRTGWTQAQNNAVLDKDAWGTRIESLKDLQPTISIEVSNTWNSGTRTVDATVECDVLTNIDSTYKIAVYITEDSIIQAQLTENDIDHPDNIIYDYAHRHVLRGSMNSTWGDTLVASNASSGAQFTKFFSSTLNSGWNEDHCYLVVLVFNAETYEIMQVEEKKIK